MIGQLVATAAFLCSSVSTKPPTETGSLVGTMRAVEIREDGSQVDVPSNGTVEIDINSTVQLIMDRAEIEAEMAATAGTDLEKLASVQAQVKTMIGLLQQD